MSRIFYLIFIYPIVQIIEIVYMLIYKIFNSPGISVIGVSFAVTLLCLPLYIVAEKWQEKEREITNILKPKITKIKKVFKGDEQFMILSTYYKQNHYHPIYALRNSFGILIQIPFFLAAYSFISHLEFLKDYQFLFIKDMGSPDQLLSIGSLSINILPVLMTLINIISGILYTYKLQTRDRVQVFVTAVLFLILLYNSVAGLVVYWTMNNILSLVKNIFYKLKNPKKILFGIFYSFMMISVFYLLVLNSGALKKRLFLSSALLLCGAVPIIYTIIINKKIFSKQVDSRQRNILFIFSSLILFLLAGIAIPSSAIATAPEEFSFIDSIRSPFPFIINSSAQAFGLFFFWPVCLFYLFNNKIKNIFTFLFSFLALLSIINVFILKGNYSTLSNTFKFNSLSGLAVFPLLMVFSIISILLVFSFVLFVFLRNKMLVINNLSIIVIVSLAALTVFNITKINSDYKKIITLNSRKVIESYSLQPVFSFSREKQNVMVIMADCAINGYIQPIFDENPELKQTYSGFTLFPNTLSFALHTIMGAPPIWGGYEYAPLEMNKRDSIQLVDKHNEALLLMPTLLSQAGYNITVTDPPWANYASINDTSIYDDLENVTAFNSIGEYTSSWYSLNNFEDNQYTSKKIFRNTIWFSFLSIMPPFLRIVIYDDGWYWGNEEYIDTLTKFINSYAVLDFLPRLTTFDSDKPSVILMTNDTTHDLALLQYPDYVPVNVVTKFGKGPYSRDPYYHINSAFYLKLGTFLQFLKDQNIYDNTRIIIVSDHSTNYSKFKIGDSSKDIDIVKREGFNAVLLFKDFNDSGSLKSDMAFMTNADVPLMALKDLVDPVNPFTGNLLTDNSKKDGVVVTINHLPQAYLHGKNKFKIQNNQWVHIHDNIFDKKNWSYIKP